MFSKVTMSQLSATNNFTKGFVTPEFGLLPSIVPASALPAKFSLLDNAAKNLKTWIKEKNIEAFKRLNDELNITLLIKEIGGLSDSELARAKLIVGKIGHAYGYILNTTEKTKPHFDIECPNLFLLWQKLAERMNHSPEFPILTSSDTTYCNWRYKNPKEQHSLENLKDLDKLEQLVPLFDNREEIVTNLGVVVFEAHIAPVVHAIENIVKAMEVNDMSLLSDQLDIILSSIQYFSNTFAEFYNFHRGSGEGFIDLKTWGDTVMKAVIPCYPEEKAQLGSDVSLFGILDALTGRNKYESRLGKSMQASQTLLPENHRRFIQYVKDANIKEFINRCENASLKMKFQQISEAYVGKHGFFGIHTEVAMSGIVVTSGSNVNQSGVKLDTKLGDNLEEARKERENPEFENVIRFQIIGQEKISSEESAESGNFSVGLKLCDHKLDKAKSILAGIQPGSCIYIPIKNSMKHLVEFASLLELLKTVIDFNVEVDIHDNEAWRRALSKWPECSGKTKFTLKELLVYVDLNQLVQSLKKGQSINLRENFLPAPDRVYSVNTVDVENGILNLLVKRQVYRDGSLGAGSYFLTNKESIGQQVSCHILPPLSFTLPKDNNKPILLFANGNGVAPFTHFLSELNKNKCTNPVCLVYLTRSEQEDWLEMQLRQHSQLLSNFQCCVIYTGKNKRVEWLTNSKIDSVNSSHDKLFAIDEVINRFKPEEFMACICGSVPFTKTLLDTLKKELGENRFLRMVGNSQLVYEAFSFTESDEVRKASLNREFTLDEINKHNTQESCWVTVDGTVYDITDFLNIHKAGRDMFLSKALVDRDMTAMYRLTHNGSSTAESWLQSYRIGRIKVTTADYPSVTVEPQTKPCPLSIQDTVLQMHPISADTATCPFLSRPRKTDSLQKEKLAANTSESTPKDLLIKSSEKLESTPDISASKSWCGFFKRAISLIGIRVSADADPIYEKQYI